MAVSMAERRTRARGLKRHAFVALAAVAAAVLMTWPLARDAGREVLAAIYYWDAFTNAMIMGGRVDAALGRGPLSLYDDYFFAPLPRSIVFNENLFGLSLLFAPFYLATNDPLWAYNITLLASLALSTFFTYLLVRRLTQNGYAGFLAGVAFAFCPYVFFEIGRIQLVATQWIPACFLFLHRAIEGQRREGHSRRDVIGLWVCYLLQIGTCLYYAMFLIPLLTLVGGMLLWRSRPPPKLYVELAAVGAVALVVALGMVYPYFTARDAFALERSLAFASGYDGKLDFFGNVAVTNHTLTSLHHSSERGAREEIAFPGFTVLALGLVALAVAAQQALGRTGSSGAPTNLGRWCLVGVLCALSTLLTHSMLVGALALGAGLWWVKSGVRRPSAQREAPARVGARSLYLALLCLSVVMFLGLAPFEWEGTPVRGLYYYFHTYFPGFNGIRKVSRQAVMTTFAFVVLSSFGSAWLLSRAPAWLGRIRLAQRFGLRRLSSTWVSFGLFGLLLGCTCYELRSFPHATVPVWAGASLPQAYHFMASLPQGDLVAGLPQAEGTRVFRGDAGRAFHNYLMLFHKHRSVNGQSSYTLPVTDLVERMLRHLPDDAARRVLASIGTRHLVVHAGDLAPPRQSLPDELARRSSYFRRVFQQGTDSVFTFVPQHDPALELLEVPKLPERARPVPASALRASASLEADQAERGIDGDLRSYWSTRRSQARGQYFELRFERELPVIAFEIDSQWHVSNVPLSFELSVARAGSAWKTVASEPVVRVYREQIYSPKTFVFRVVLPVSVMADRLRLSVGQPLPEHEFVVHEARVYATTP